MNLRIAIEERVARHPRRLAVRFGESRQTYEELNRSIDRAGWSLRELGAKPGARVGLMLPNCPEMVWCWLALAKLGATMVPINTRLKGDSLRYLLGHAKLDQAVVGGEALISMAQASEPARASTIIRVGRASEPARAGTLARPTLLRQTECWPDLGELLAQAPSDPLPQVNLRPDGLAAIMYTSGTTGRPKGAMIGRQAQLSHGLNYVELLGIQEEETAYAFLPLFHVTAAGTVLGSLLGGGNVAIDAAFSPFGFWERTRRYQAVVFSFVGSVLSLLFSRPLRPDDRTNPVRRAMGAATPVWLWRAFEERFGLEIWETYGQTELASLWLMPPADGARVGTVGKPPHGRFEAKIVDEDGQALAPNVRGEIAIRPRDPAEMSSGYLGDPAATAAAFREDGWYYTGDLGEQDADGYFKYVGRLRDCIRRRGENIAAYEIEQVVNAHPSVLESAAVGVPAALGEEEVKLCVVGRPRVSIDPREIFTYCRDELPAFMVPRFIQVRKSLPKTATERVRKAELRDEGTGDCWQAVGRHARLQ